MSPLLEELKKDLTQHGYGRRKWWADRLGIPPLTLSHWLADRQRPNGKNALAIRNILGQLEDDERRAIWKEYLWESYYSGEKIPKRILPVLILEILSLSTLDSRSLSLLSRLVEKERPRFPIPSQGRLKNRLGWLLAVSGQAVPFAPDLSLPSQSLLPSSLQSSQLEKYFRRFQTGLGKKWRIYDCPLDSIKASLP